MKKTGIAWTLAGGVFAGVVASLCCLVPLLSLGLGLGSFAVAAAFAEWRPFFLLLTFLLLGLAWYLVYRRPRAGCGDGTCARRPGKVFRATLWAGTLISVLAAAYPWLAGVRHAAATAPVAVSSAERFSVSIPTMDCAACAAAIEAALRGAPGVLQARVDYATKTADVFYDAAITDRAKLLTLVDETGFPAERSAIEP